MAAISSSSQLLLLFPAVLILLLSSLHPSAGDGADQMSTIRMTLINQCDYPVWPGILPSKGFAQLRGGGCKLETGDILSFVGLSAGWSGQVWARTQCLGGTTTLTCVTGDCGPNLECAGRYGALPFTAAKVSMDATGLSMTYGVSIVEGFNVPMAVMAVSAQGTACPVAGCQMDLLGVDTCPAEQMFFSPVCAGGRSVAGCRCLCLSGPLGPCETSEMVKRRCPNLITFRGDQAKETMMCQSVIEVQVAFCPTRMTAVPLLKQVVSSTN